MKLNELEIKIQISSEEHFQAVYDSCNKLFGPPISHVIQLDEYYDTPDGQLKKQDLVIRIRSNGEKKTIALKSPRIELPSGMTNRIELEFLSAEGEKVHEQLISQGLNPNEAAEKERWTFINNDCEIVLDRLPFIGSFIEIEGPSEIEISKIVSLLNLSSCQIVRQNYGELMMTKFCELQLPLSNLRATFANEIECKNFK
ncbi:MAG: class IV adenylate cyclase [Parachlamydiaceae bacterium]|nr:class IV adenylate cyclase [Parachlamydiaceae bacterium]